MKKIILILLLIADTICSAQTVFNKGGAVANNYYIELPYQEVKNKMIVKVHIAGEIRNFLFDTGAPTAVYNTYSHLVNLSNTQKDIIHDSQGNKDSTYISVVPEILLGNVAFNDIPVLLLPPDFFSQCLEIDGFIGSNLLRNSIIQFDTQRKVIIITDNLKRLNVLKKHRSKLYLNKQSSPYVQVRLKGKSTSTLATLFDSGYDGFFDFSFSDYPLLAKNKIIADSVIGYGASSMGILGWEKKTKKVQVKFEKFKISNTTFEDVWAETSSGSRAKVGTKLLDYGKVTIDYKNKNFFFEPYENMVVQPEAWWGITPFPHDGKLFVGLVWKNYADQIEVGDEIIAIDGDPVPAQNLCELYLNSPLKDKNEAVFTLKRKDGTTFKQQMKKVSQVPAP